MVELAKRRLGSRAVVLRADLNESLPFADDAFDVVLCPLVIHHVGDRTATLREFFRVLRSGGRGCSRGRVSCCSASLSLSSWPAFVLLCST
jgi:ubiquinone/menaquinone biosynthesis C-methylase UbiE